MMLLEYEKARKGKYIYAAHIQNIKRKRERERDADKYRTRNREIKRYVEDRLTEREREQRQTDRQTKNV